MTPDPYRKYSGTGGGRKPPRQQHRLTRFMLLLAALCLCVLLVRSRIFVVREIVVTGNSMRSDAQIAGQSGIRLGMSIFSVTYEMVSGNLSADNYVELVDVLTEMPDTVILEVRERTPSAAINCAGVIMLIDKDGYILERMSSLPGGNIIIVNGMDVAVSAQGKTIESRTAGQLRVMREILAALESAGMNELVSEVNVEDQDNLYLISNTGIQVLLGDSEQLNDKLAWMRAVLEVLTQDGETRGVLDVSSGKNATFSRR